MSQEWHRRAAAMMAVGETTELNEAMNSISIETIQDKRPVSEDNHDNEVEVEVEKLSPAELVDFARWGESALIEALCERGLGDRLTTAVDERGNTMLHVFAANGSTECVKLFLEACPQVEQVLNAQNHEGNTPLHWSCITGQLESCQLLLAAGANVAIENRVERTPICEAHRHRRDALLALFEQALARKEDEGKDQVDGAMESEH